ncbi:unnamed protein product [Triticum turgidum subsp. durum]|uniref:Uncharacterized protein n=1 Tax=Triticum turgidum subsp. durum TaxID=4567 RepID=A0A9R0S6F4_TRITD|nr:unnamed protein product [Triticum turgidum subsp. durum]
MSSGHDSSGTTLMDLITSDPSAAPAAGASSQQPSSGGGGGSLGRPAPPPAPAPADRKSKRATLMQIQSDTISAAKAFNPVKALPQRNRKKKAPRLVLAAGAEHPRACGDVRPEKIPEAAREQCVPQACSVQFCGSFGGSIQQCEDRNVLRYVYYYLARILSDNGSQGLSAAGGIPTPNWDALADIDVAGGVTRADVVPRIVDQLSAESTSDDVECFHKQFRDVGEA